MVEAAVAGVRGGLEGRHPASLAQGALGAIDAKKRTNEEVLLLCVFAALAFKGTAVRDQIG